MDPKELDVQINDLETRIDRLKALYEQYFQGIDRLEPTVPRKEVDRKLAMLRKEQLRNTAQRFRLQSLVQRYTSYQTHWGRITRQIEEGTYKRDLMRAKKLRTKVQEERSSRPPEWALGVDFEDTNDFFNDLGFDTTEHVKPSMGAPAPASMSFARPKDLPNSPPEKAAPAVRRVPSVPPRPMTAAPQAPAPLGASPGSPPMGAPRAPSPLAPPRAPASVMPSPASRMPMAPSVAPMRPPLSPPARPPMPTAAPPAPARAPVPTMAPRAPVPTVAPRAPVPTMAPRAPMPTAAPPPARPPAPTITPTMAPAPRAPAPPTARPPAPPKKPGT